MKKGSMYFTFMRRAFILFIVAACTSCQLNAKKEKIISPPGYDLTKPVTILLRSDLDEISGIDFFAKDTSVFAINDEQGTLFKIFIRNEVKIETWKFSQKGDYEDIKAVDSAMYILESNGTLMRLQFTSNDSLLKQEYKISLKGKNEFESLYYDASLKNLVLICKDCNDDNKKKVSAYGFDPTNRTFINEPVFTIKGKKIVEKSEVDKDKFKPSAAAINPVTNELFIVSAINRTLVVADRDGSVKEIYDLDPAKFKQPEGITFSPDGTMLISNESAGTGTGEILIFKYKEGK